MTKYTLFSVFLFITSSLSHAIQPLFSGYPPGHVFFNMNLGFMMNEQRAREYLDQHYGHQQREIPSENDDDDSILELCGPNPISESEDASEECSDEECSDAEAAEILRLCTPGLLSDSEDEPSPVSDVDSTDTVKEQFSRRKTKICKFYLRKACPKGEDCSFAHGAHELCKTWRDDKPVCKFFARSGKCKFGKRCRYAHIPQ